MLRNVMTATLILSPISALAHPGDHHDGFLATMTHLLTEPNHLAMIAMAVTAGVWGIRRMAARKAAKNR